MDLWHHVHLLLNNHRYHLEPLKPHTKRILDLGTGTGIWAIEMAEQHPEIQFTGVDLAPIQPEVYFPLDSWVGGLNEGNEGGNGG